MQTSLSGKQGVLPALSRALHMESGVLDKFRLSFTDDFAALRNDFVMAVFLFRLFYKIRTFFQNYVKNYFVFAGS